jgi:hypothetical protein
MTQAVVSFVVLSALIVGWDYLVSWGFALAAWFFGEALGGVFKE